MTDRRDDTGIDCRRLEEAVADVLGGEGSPELAQALAGHLAGCAACAGSHAGLQGLLQAARSTPVPEPGEDYWAAYLPELRRRIEAGQRPAGFAAWLRPVLASAALVVLALVATGRSPGRAPGPAAAIPRSAEELGPALDAARDLSAALDRLDDPFALPGEEMTAELGPLPAAEPELSGDLFLFFDDTHGLDADETRALLATMSRPEAG